MTDSNNINRIRKIVSAERGFPNMTLKYKLVGKSDTR